MFLFEIIIKKKKTSFYIKKGFTYVAPSIIEDMSRLQYSFNNGIRSPRKVLLPDTISQTYNQNFFFENLNSSFLFKI